MSKLQREPVVQTLACRGQKIMNGLRPRIERYGAAHFLSVSGHPAWSFLLIKDTPSYSQWTIKTLLLQEMFARGILTLTTHNVSYAHTEDDINRLLAVYDEVLPILVDAVTNNRMDQHLRCQPLQPLFKVR